ncbi:MAG: site-specific integrase [Planctomycetota bacterium]|nr:MAG: site-specific integrase [Planctomycetota bacterium]REJ91995.1 MAG: site-specific integrase [Planctomycetota bacterium]REK28531.1 MAG: site-specific integrase [Planctomycetota bacterium]REK39146.1 MAG: site-specific integrase [Planctomycetota bacterium]
MYYKKTHGCYYTKIDGKHYRLHPNKRQAAKMERELKEAHENDGIIDESNPTVREIITEFLEWTELNKKPRTFKWYQDYLAGPRGFAAFVKKNLLVRNLKKTYVTQWMQKHWKHTSDNTRAGAITALKRVFNWAVEEDLIDASPIAKYKKPHRTSRSDEAYLSPDQWNKVVAAINYAELLDYLTVMRETGCRPQEIRTLRAEWFDRENRRWVFPVEESKGGRDKAKKPRIVELTDKAFSICQKWALKYPEGPMFRNSKGRPWTASALKCACTRISEKVGFKVFPYALRHTFATDALLNEVGMQETAELLGHCDTQMLSRHYQHIAAHREHLKKALRKARGDETGAA